jgi:hypothetical protein
MMNALRKASRTGWKPELLATGRNGASVVLLSSDLKQSTVIDKNTLRANVPKALINGLDSILKYEEELKKGKSEAAKPQAEFGEGKGAAASSPPGAASRRAEASPASSAASGDKKQ